MTERHHSNPPQIATPINLGLDNFHPTESVDEEPYEIKCICDYRDDDGNTILCEKCNTWQHIECYYHGKAEDASKEEFDHACADCHPRHFDRTAATERQRKQRQLQESPEGADKKSKRRVEKSHKKKTRPADVQTNGWHNGDHDAASTRKNHSPQDHLPPKKAKSHHKSTNSASSQVGKRSPSIGTYNGRNHGGRPLSPSRTPPDLPATFEIHSYSPEFRRLYDDDPGDKILTANAFSSLMVTNSMSSWLHDTVKLEEDTGINDTAGIFQKVVPAQNDHFFEKLARENLLVKDKWDNSPDGQKLHWRYLTTAEPRQPLSILGELKGVVGFQSDYHKDPKNLYPVLAHPQPFVFFHPDLPIYIDTRSEGSKCRYIRRSCRANSTLDTYIVNQSEYHFCIVNEEPITADTQLTLPWDIQCQNARWAYLLGLAPEQDAMADEPEMPDSEYQEISKWLHTVLSAYGGCACDLGKDCAFARFHRDRLGRVQVLQTQANGVKKRVGRPPKSKQHVSPTTTGHATNSRAPSESHHEQTEDNEHDRRSNSGSHKSKGRSRELSPRSLGDESNENFGIGDNISMRDKRKIAQLEEYSRRQTQSAEVKQPPLKKKRTSGGSSASNSTSNVPKERAKAKNLKASMSAEPVAVNGTSIGTRKIHYADAGTSRPMSESPIGLSPTDMGAPQSRRASSQMSVQSRRVSMAPRASYADMATQTDPVPNKWYSPLPATSKKTQIPLAKRLISYRHNARKACDARLRTEALVNGISSKNGSLSSPVSLSSPEMVHAQPPAPITDGRKQSVASTPGVAETPYANDVPMVDAPPSAVPNMIKPPPPPWPLTTANPTNNPFDSVPKPPDLRLLLPSTSQIDHPMHHQVTNSDSMTPLSAIGTASSFPSSHHNNGLSSLMTNSVAPSPVKKKLSLSDYSARFNKNKDTKPAATNSSPIMTPSILKPSESFFQSARLPGVLEGSALVETPSAEKEKLDVPMADFVTISESVQSAGTGQVSG